MAKMKGSFTRKGLPIVWSIWQQETQALRLDPCFAYAKYHLTGAKFFWGSECLPQHDKSDKKTHFILIKNSLIYSLHILSMFFTFWFPHFMLSDAAVKAACDQEVWQAPFRGKLGLAQEGTLCIDAMKTQSKIDFTPNKTGTRSEPKKASPADPITTSGPHGLTWERPFPESYCFTSLFHLPGLLLPHEKYQRYQKKTRVSE